MCCCLLLLLLSLNLRDGQDESPFPQKQGHISEANERAKTRCQETGQQQCDTTKTTPQETEEAIQKMQPVEPPKPAEDLDKENYKAPTSCQDPKDRVTTEAMALLELHLNERVFKPKDETSYYPTTMQEADN
jgi:hypothetical protein